MPVPDFKIVEVQIIGDLSEQEVRNVMFYEAASDAIDASEIAQSCATQFQTEMLPQLSSAYVLRRVEYRNLFNASESGTIDVIDQPGGIAAESLPPHDSLSVQLVHDEPAIRKGRKSLAGAVESANVDGIIPTATLASFSASTFDWLVPALKDVATGLVDIAIPVIVKRIVESTPVGKSYRLPDNRLEALIGRVYQVVLSAYIRTQNSRKIGYGS